MGLGESGRAPLSVRRGGSAVAILGLSLLAAPAGAFSFADGRIELHGFFQTTVRTLSDGYHGSLWYQSQWANVLNLESDLAIAPDGWGPFDLVSGFARVEVRYECIYRGCGTSSHRNFGDRSGSGPARNWTNGHSSGRTGLAANPKGPIDIHGDGTTLLGLLDNPLLDELREFGGTNLEATFAPLLSDAFVFKETYLSGGSLASSYTQLGPWRPESTVRPNSSLATVPDPTLRLPMRPQVPDPGMARIPQGANGLYIPSVLSRQSLNRDDYGSMDLNFNQTDLEWNHGAGQDEQELKEAYVEFEMFDSRLWVRAGKQNIVWGKTELFRTTDQFNPQDIALASLPSLEESRLGLWSARGVWSFYDVGPLEDVRFELAFNYDDFEPTDLGICGQPYTVWLVCGKGGAAYAHGFTGLGLVGEIRPEDPWDDASGIEVGVRIEWRWDRFSFALTDFYGYSDTPYLDSIAFYERAVDVRTGRPLAAASTGRCDPDGLFGPLDSTGCLVAIPPDGVAPVPGDPGFANNALDFHPSNRELFDVVCSATVGVASRISDLLAARCLLDVVNDTSLSLFSIATGFPIPITDPQTQPTFSGFFSNLFVGNQVAAGFATLLGPGATFIPLNHDPGDLPLTNCSDVPVNCFYATGSTNDGTNPIRFPTLNTLLTPQQQALLGCGSFYDSNCEVDGIDLFNAEGSVLVQSFPQIEPDPPVATRFVGGQVVVLPGARDPQTDPSYDPFVDGCIAPGGTFPGDGACAPNAQELRNPLTGEFFKNELGAVSWNFMIFLASLSLPDPGCATNPPAPDCDPEQGDPDCELTTAQGLIACAAERAGVVVTGTQRPELRAAGNGRYGRRDWIWQGGGEVRLRYDKRNVLGLSMDFAEDVTKTNWGMEFTWIDDAITGSSTTESRHQSADFFNLTISVDRPTFVNFLNQNRTLFFNSQWFFGYTKGFNDSFPGNGPTNVLATFTVATGYFQDRLLPSITFVNDFQSGSGGSIIQVGYRFTENFSAQVGAAIFYGTAQDSPIATHQLALGNNGGDFESKTQYSGLSAISERDELFVSLRYTF